MRRFVKRLLMIATTLGLGALVYNLMRAEGERVLRRAHRGPAGLPPLEPSEAPRRPAATPEEARAAAEPAAAARAAPAASRVDEPARCIGVKKSGERCLREAQTGSAYCWQHG